MIKPANQLQYYDLEMFSKMHFKEGWGVGDASPGSRSLLIVLL